MGWVALAAAGLIIGFTIVAIGLRHLDFRPDRTLFTTPLSRVYPDWESARFGDFYSLPGYLGTIWSFGFRVFVVYVLTFVAKGLGAC